MRIDLSHLGDSKGCRRFNFFMVRNGTLQLARWRGKMSSAVNVLEAMVIA